MSLAERLGLIACAGVLCESAMWDEAEALAAGDLLGAADAADEAEGFSRIAFNLARGLA